MPADQAFRDLIERLIEQRREQLEAFESDETPSPRPPAEPVEIQRIEQKFGLRLPPTFVDFLSLHDGIVGFCGSYDLLGARDVLSADFDATVRRHRENAWDTGDALVVEGFLIGWRPDTGVRVYLDLREGPDKQGEYPVVEWEAEELTRVASFREFLEFREAANRVTLERMRRLLAGQEIEDELPPPGDSDED